MAVSTTVRISGGGKLDAIIRKAESATGKDAVEVGFFSTARYPDGQPVAQVALKNEFGFNPPDEPRIPARPFFRQALEAVTPELSRLMERRVDTETMVADQRLADEVGQTVADAVKQRIVSLREPPNAPRTIKQKGSSNPLIDTGQMRLSVTWRVR